MNDLIIPIHSGSKEPIYEQIYRFMKAEIKKGSLPAGERVPSTRKLAENLQISRSTVEMAYEQLLAEGYIVSQPYKGYFVAQVEELTQSDIPKVTKAEQNPVILETACLYDFSPRGIDLENFPYGVWRKITRNILQEDNKELFGNGHSQGDEELRIAICNYLHYARGVKATPDSMIIGAGNEYLLMLLSQLLGKCIVAVENPTYLQAARVLQSQGFMVKPVEMDRYGMKLLPLEEDEGINAAYVMPSHQYPLGTVMPIKRRLELLSWANAKEGRYIIEDDYDSEFRYKGKPIPALQGTDNGSNVIYMGTFSRSVAPAIRVSYMVLPKKLAERYRESIGFYSSTVSRIDQRILAEFLEGGYFERHLNRMRTIYKSKHDCILTGIEKFPFECKVLGENAGTHILLEFPISSDYEDVLVKAAFDAGVKVYGLSAYYYNGSPDRATILLGYAKMSEPAIEEGLALLKEVWSKVLQDIK